MLAEEFKAKWKSSQLKERSGSQEHFLDLCRMLGQPTPAQVDSDGSWYTFERGAAKHGGGNGFADVWMKGHFAWEYKGKRADLKAAYNQLLLYRSALENPPLLIVSDMETIEIHTNFTGTVENIHIITLDDLSDFDTRQKLIWAFTQPEKLKPGVTVERITYEAAEQFASLAETLRGRGHAPLQVAHFLGKLIFCLFAEDVGLLPEYIFTRMIAAAGSDIDEFNAMLSDLLLAMNSGGRFGTDRIRYFNGGLFNDSLVLPLHKTDVKLLRTASELKWNKVEPSIFGALFERGLDPAKRSQLGAHYTPRQDIERVIDPVVMAPLREAWHKVTTEVTRLLELAKVTEQQKNGAKKKPKHNKNQAPKRGKTKKSKELDHRASARTLIIDFLNQRVRHVRVLDPACGSGNFLYIALERLHDLEKECLLKLAEVEHGQLSLDIQVGPHQVCGIEINLYAHELAQVTVWIGHLQWMIRNGFGFRQDPVLQKLELIQQRDAVLDLTNPADPIPATWPEADYIVGNPPFLGSQKWRTELGEEYTTQLRNAYHNRVSGSADLVTYWFELARQQIELCKAKRAGLVSTNSIRGGNNRKVLERIKDTGDIFNAWRDEPWIVDGAAVRISLVCFDDGSQTQGRLLNGMPVEEIFADLEGRPATGGLNIAGIKPLPENAGVTFQGPVKVGPFDIPGSLARQWLILPTNPNGRPNSDVLRPWMNGIDVVRRPSDTWIIDFGASMSEEAASLYEVPFEYVKNNVKPGRERQRDAQRKARWWLHGRTGEAMRAALTPLRRYVATARVAKHRIFVWITTDVLPDCQLVVVARDDDTTFGILHSRIHEVWSLRMCSWLGMGNDPRYTPTTTFQTFAFPEGLGPQIPAVEFANDVRSVAIAEAAKKLNLLRERWLNPPELVVRTTEVMPGYRKRVVPINESTAIELKKRTLTNLYNIKPTWLVNAHRELDTAVAAAYGWQADLSDDDISQRLIDLNHSRIPAQEHLTFETEAEDDDLG